MPSYEQSKSSKLWSVRFRELGEDGILHNKRLSGFKTKKLAQFAYEDYAAERKAQAEEIADKPQVPDLPSDDANDIFFEDLVKEFLKYKKGRTKESSYYDTENKINNRILPYFLCMRMNEIKPITVVDWLQKLQDDGYSHTYRSGLMSILVSIYRYGERYMDVTNIMPKVDRPRNLEPKKEMLFWTSDEFERFIRCVNEPTCKVMFWTLYITGCRRGEASALTWDDIDLGGGTININKSITRKTRGATYKVTTPKNAGSNRIVAIPPFLCKHLAEYKAWQATQGKGTAFVFGGNHPIGSSTMDYHFRTAAEAAGVKKIRIHDLRHSCASLLISKGVSIVAVSRRLGHNNIEQTLNTYSHMMPDDQSQIIKIMESLDDGK